MIKKKIPKTIKPILDEVKKKLEEYYGNKLKGIILYGSYARGDATEGSDIDLIILLKEVENACKEITKCSEALGDLELNYDTLISIIPFDVNDFKERRLPVILNAKREGILI